jgi:hypothetical protein
MRRITANADSSIGGNLSPHAASNPAIRAGRAHHSSHRLYSAASAKAMVAIGWNSCLSLPETGVVGVPKRQLHELFDEAG